MFLMGNSVSYYKKLFFSGKYYVEITNFSDKY